MGVQGDFIAGLRQMKEGGIGDVDFIAQARALNQRLARSLFDQNTSDTTNQAESPVAPGSGLLLSHTTASDFSRATGHPQDTLTHVGMAHRDGERIGRVCLGFA